MDQAPGQGRPPGIVFVAAVGRFADQHISCIADTFHQRVKIIIILHCRAFSLIAAASSIDLLLVRLVDVVEYCAPRRLRSGQIARTLHPRNATLRASRDTPLRPLPDFPAGIPQSQGAPNNQSGRARETENLWLPRPMVAPACRNHPLGT
jgi:hypothetical protein